MAHAATGEVDPDMDPDQPRSRANKRSAAPLLMLPAVGVTVVLSEFVASCKPAFTDRHVKLHLPCTTCS
jgi:hypothetical protein